MWRKRETKSFIRRRLPHWEVDDGVYFVTISQYGAIPAEAAERIRTMRRNLDQFKSGELLDRQRAIFRELELWLDRADNDGDLTNPVIANMIIGAINHRSEKQDWKVHSYVVMKNHIHLFFKPITRDLFESLVQFKRWTGGQANRTLHRKGSFWAREWFDHWSRSPEEDERIINYIANNPVKAGLCKVPSEWPYYK